LTIKTSSGFLRQALRAKTGITAVERSFRRVETLCRLPSRHAKSSGIWEVSQIEHRIRSSLV
jgi:hypothetical protein